ncbi:MAG: hypothetical protein ACRCYU_22750 [Nocardioides sp.]
MTWRDELEKEIATAEDAKRVAASRRAAAEALEPQLRVEARNLLLESVEVLRKQGCCPGSGVHTPRRAAPETQEPRQLSP